MTAVSVPETTGHRGSALEVLRVFTKLGLTSFGVSISAEPGPGISVQSRPTLRVE
jgi:hypothetical protein